VAASAAACPEGVIPTPPHLCKCRREKVPVPYLNLVVRQDPTSGVSSPVVWEDPTSGVSSPVVWEDLTLIVSELPTLFNAPPVVSREAAATLRSRKLEEEESMCGPTGLSGAT